MRAFISTYYRSVFVVLIGALIGLSFYGGILYGKGSGAQPSVVLSCTEDMLSELIIPTKALASNPQATSEEVSNTVLMPEATLAKEGKYVGSKNGTKYYLPTCGSVKRIKPENYKWFQTADDAELQGYTLGSC